MLMVLLYFFFFIVSVLGRVDFCSSKSCSFYPFSVLSSFSDGVYYVDGVSAVSMIDMILSVFGILVGVATIAEELSTSNSGLIFSTLFCTFNKRFLSFTDTLRRGMTLISLPCPPRLISPCAFKVTFRGSSLAENSLWKTWLRVLKSS